MDTHAYVYAFAHQSNGWIKVGMTEKNDEQRCWDRINHYIKQHRLPDEGWEFVGFVATYKTRALETRIRWRAKNGRRADWLSAKPSLNTIVNAFSMIVCPLCKF